MGRIHEYVLDTSSKVQTLGDRSREINNIVEVIANIAHQTNRLALDAAIQAAMAGENGKGFGAVAADIRRLAERAKDQASSIGRIVRGVREDIGAVAVSMRDTERETSAGAELAQEAGNSLESIFGVVERQAYEIEAINQMAAQQLQSSSAVVQIMQAVSDTTQQSSGSTRDAAQNMERLARLAEQLLASVEAFKLRENLNYYAPMGNVTITPQDEFDNNQLSVSGAFRTVTASAQSSNNNALAPARTSGSFSPYPMTPYQQNNGVQSHPQWPVQSER
jgi:methyl-accepting chemotaxis protein